MAVTLNSNGITFGDATSQNTAATAGAVGINKITTFLSSGTFARPPTTNAMWAVVVGGGGGAALASAGGQAGLAVLNIPTDVPNYTVNIGGGGGQSSPAFGAAGGGGTSSILAGPGTPATAYVNATGGAGGQGSNAGGPVAGAPGVGNGQINSTRGAHSQFCTDTLFDVINSPDPDRVIFYQNAFRNDRGSGGASVPGNPTPVRFGIAGIATIFYNE